MPCPYITPYGRVCDLPKNKNPLERLGGDESRRGGGVTTVPPSPSKGLHGSNLTEEKTGVKKIEFTPPYTSLTMGDRPVAPRFS
jgi:hypothetical protein